VHIGGSVSGVHAGVRINASPGHQRHSGAKPSTHGSGSGKNNLSTTTHGSRTPRPAPSAKRGHQPAAGSFATVPTSRTPQHANPDKSQRTVTHRSHRIPVRHQHAQPQPRHQKPLSTQFFEQVTRPGSPAMILSLIVLMCLLGTAFVVLMGRRRKPRQSG
jgi:hypothetical protein